MKAREIGRTRVVVGDDVALVGDLAGGPDALARIVRIEERRSVLRRTADDTDPFERIIVANADQLVIVTALADPEPRPRMVDRCLVAAYDADLVPLLALTKADLVDPAAFLAELHAARGRARRHLDGRTASSAASRTCASSCPAGSRCSSATPASARARSSTPSCPGAPGHRRRQRHDRPRPAHVDERRRAAPARRRSTSWVIDTPGIRSFGLAHIDVDHIIDHFPDLAAGTDDCPRGCTHDEEECALDAWVAEGHAGPAGKSRLESLRRLLSSRRARPTTDTASRPSHRGGRLGPRLSRLGEGEPGVARGAGEGW